MLTTPTLSGFLGRLGQGLSRKAAWEGLGTPLSLETGYRIWRRWRRALSHIRTFLHQLGHSPPASGTECPVLELFDQLTEVFPHTPCACAAFQGHFQAPLLP